MTLCLNIHTISHVMGTELLNIIRIIELNSSGMSCPQIHHVIRVPSRKIWVNGKTYQIWIGRRVMLSGLDRVWWHSRVRVTGGWILPPQLQRVDTRCPNGLVSGTRRGWRAPGSGSPPQRSAQLDICYDLGSSEVRPRHARRGPPKSRFVASCVRPFSVSPVDHGRMPTYAVTFMATNGRFKETRCSRIPIC